MLHVSRTLSYIYICLQEHGFLKRTSYCRTGYLPFLNTIVIFTGLVQGILRSCIGYCAFCIEFCTLKKMAANWKTCYIWYNHIVYFYFYGDTIPFELSLHILTRNAAPFRDSSILCRVEKPLYYISQRKTANERTLLLCKQEAVHCYMQHCILGQECHALNSC